MQCYTQLTPIDTAAHACGTAVALGYFDGVHLGHRSVLRAAQETAQREGLADAVFTFVLPTGDATDVTASGNANAAAGGNANASTCAVGNAQAPSEQTASAVSRPSPAKGRALLTQTEKRRRMSACGVQHYFCPPFDAFCAFTPEQFVQEILVRCLGARAVFCGDNFTFGVKKSGNVTLLRRLCAARSIAVHVVEMAQYQGESVSSSRIRAALTHGELAAANAMLGQAYCLALPVQHGKQLGRTLGFPTINQVYPPDMLVPREGVYLTRTLVQDADGTQTWHPSATGLGTRPTVTGDALGTAVTCETFIANFSGTLYGETAYVEFCAYWQPTQRFASLDALKAFIGQAAAAAQAYFAQDVLEQSTQN